MDYHHRRHKVRGRGHPPSTFANSFLCQSNLVSLQYRTHIRPFFDLKTNWNILALKLTRVSLLIRTIAECTFYSGSIAVLICLPVPSHAGSYLLLS